MGMACSGLTHCTDCGGTLQIGEYGQCNSCKEEKKIQDAKKTKKKIYKGYELMKEIAEGNIKERK